MSASREKQLRKEERLADGTFQPKKKKTGSVDKSRRNIAITLTLAAVVVLVCLMLLGSGKLHENMAALTIGNTKITIAEYNFNYNTAIMNFKTEYADILSYIGIDFSSSLKQQDSGDGSWADYFHERTVSALRQYVAKSSQAKSEGLVLPKEYTDSLNTSMDELSAYAVSYGVALDEFLESNYGKGVNSVNIRSFIERQMYANYWDTVTNDNLNFTVEDIQAKYDSDPTAYDLVDNYFYKISGGIDAELMGLEGEEAETAKAEALEAARVKADEMLSKLTTPDKFAEVAASYDPPAEEDEEDETAEEDAEEVNEDTTLMLENKASSLTDNLKAWLFDPSRKYGDKTVIQEDTDFCVLMFVNRYLHDYSTKSVRHALVKFASESQEDKDSALLKAEGLYAEWLEGSGGEAGFIELVKDHSDDTASVSKGGLYENIKKGEMMESFEDWCFADGRKPGDSGIVETSYGYHIMYFVSDGLKAWQKDISDDMRNAALTERQNEVIEATEVKNHGFAVGIARIGQ